MRLVISLQQPSTLEKLCIFYSWLKNVYMEIPHFIKEMGKKMCYGGDAKFIFLEYDEK